MVCLRNVSVDTLHKGDTEDDDYDDNNNNNNNNNNNFIANSYHIKFKNIGQQILITVAQ